VLDMALIATREIKKDEEILMDYGRGWERAWEAFTGEIESHQRDHVLHGTPLPNATFRQFIAAVEGLFPAEW